MESNKKLAWVGTPSKSLSESRDNPMEKSARTLTCSEPKGTAQMDNRPMQTSRLFLLPRELIDMIIESVKAKRDLSNLSKACLALREAALPFLFRDIKIVLSGDRVPRLLRAISEPGDGLKLLLMVKKFDLTVHSYHARSLVVELIQAAPKLTRLDIYYVLNRLQWGRQHDKYIDGNALSTALTNVKNTLVHLKITYRVIGDGKKLAHAGSMSGLLLFRAMNCLRTADIPFLFLLGWIPEKAPSLADVLPSSLNTLTFGDDEWWLDSTKWNEGSMMEKFAEYLGGEAWKETTPELKKVVLSLRGYDSATYKAPEREWRRDAGERNFRRLCKENGLECQVIRHPFVVMSAEK